MLGLPGLTAPSEKVQNCWVATEVKWRELDLLPEGEKAQFVLDFARSFMISAELEQWSTLAQTIQEWRNTAVIYADSGLAQQLSMPLDEADYGSVPNPSER